MGAFFSATLADHAVVSSHELTTYLGAALASDTAHVSDTFNHQIILSATLADNVEVSAAQLLTMIYNGTLADNVVIRALYVSPAGETTTWVMNTRTNALTEYRNWSFNSFAQFGQNKYIAADQTGLYELDGERDFGANIQSVIRSGYMQWNASRLSGLKAAYLGMRTDTGGDFVFKLIGGDGQEYAYAVKANPNLMTTKIDIGKGLRTRYFAFELDSTGADFEFDFDSIGEFTRVPSSCRSGALMGAAKTPQGSHPGFRSPSIQARTDSCVHTSTVNLNRKH